MPPILLYTIYQHQNPAGNVTDYSMIIVFCFKTCFSNNHTFNSLIIQMFLTFNEMTDMQFIEKKYIEVSFFVTKLICLY